MAEQPDSRRSFYERYGAAITPVLTTSIFAICGVLVTNVYQARNAATQLISEREKAESELRASMFRDLIEPVVGDTKRIPPERERLLVELLALNFGEHFELKPLLREADRKLRQAMITAANAAERERLQEECDSLRSVSRRVATRQVAMLLNQGTGVDRTRVVPLAFQAAAAEEAGTRELQRKVREGLAKDRQVGGIGTGEAIRLCSPDSRHVVSLSISGCRWEEGACLAHINVQEGPCSPAAAGSPSPPGTGRGAADVEFEFSHFDFPLNDNTLLSDGNRFALVLQDLNPELGTVMLDFIWFTKVYFSPRERPINYADIRKRLRIEPNR